MYSENYGQCKDIVNGTSKSYIKMITGYNKARQVSTKAYGMDDEQQESSERNVFFCLFSSKVTA
jgi:hypothetical protein